MRFHVTIWKSIQSSCAEIRTWVEATDPVTAALEVMARLGLDAASTVIVSDRTGIVGHFVDVEVSRSSSPGDCALSYDYSLL